MVEKVKYYERLLNQRNDKIADLEKNAARSEAEKRKEREEYSKRDRERVEEIFKISRRMADNKDPYALRDAQRSTNLMDQLGHAQKNTSITLPHFNSDQLARELERKRMDQQPLQGFQAEWTRPQIESERVAKLEEKVKHLQSMLVQKQSEVDTMNKWQFGDQYLG